MHSNHSIDVTPQPKPAKDEIGDTHHDKIDSLRAAKPSIVGYTEK